MPTVTDTICNHCNTPFDALDWVDLHSLSLDDALTANADPGDYHAHCCPTCP